MPGKYKLGLSVVHPAAKLHWSAMRLKYGTRKVAAPLSVDYLSVMPADMGMMGNDEYGDCYWAAIGHGDQVRTKNVGGTMLSQPTATVLKWYSEGTGFNPHAAPAGQPNPTDNGSDPAAGFNYIEKHGLVRADGSKVKLLAAFEIDPRNTDDVMEAMEIGYGLMTGINVPQSLEDDMDNPIWDYVPGRSQSVGGHEILTAKRLTPTGNTGLVSWSKPSYEMTPAFWDEFVNQLTVCISQRCLRRDGQVPVRYDRGADGRRDAGDPKRYDQLILNTFPPGRWAAAGGGKALKGYLSRLNP